LTESLDRLGLPSVDIYYLHRDDTRVPAEELIEAANEHVTSGRARALGASNWSAARLARANAHAVAKGLHPFAILQNQWSLAEPNWTDLDAPGAVRYVLASEEAQLVELGVPVAAWSPTANGFFATNGARGGSYGSDAGRARLARANELAARKGVTPNQIALAYLLCHPVTTIPILGTGSAEHLEDALGAVSVELSAKDLDFLTRGGR
jgi:aryl-alcohol dehydrogenase-like predicted oxidoreductase